jgi:hypothetical protein
MSTGLRTSISNINFPPPRSSAGSNAAAEAAAVLGIRIDSDERRQTDRPRAAER